MNIWKRWKNMRFFKNKTGFPTKLCFYFTLNIKSDQSKAIPCTLGCICRVSEQESLIRQFEQLSSHSAMDQPMDSVLMDWWTNGPMDWQSYGQTHPLIEMQCASKNPVIEMLRALRVAPRGLFHSRKIRLYWWNLATLSRILGFTAPAWWFPPLATHTRL